MKPIKMFMMKTCPYCRKAFGWMDECKAEHPEYNDIEVTMVDEREQPALANQYDYYYVPTYYIGDEKVHEGAASREIIDEIFAKAYQD